MRPELKHEESADYIWNGEDWDKKDIEGSSKRTIDSALKDKSNQAHNFILKITNKTNLTKNEIKIYSKKIFSTLKREWIKNIIIIDEKYKVIAFYKRK